jgi:murein tripeptide amidase MpaA
MLLLLAAITVSTAFEGGNLGKVETVSPEHLRCAVAGQSDQDGRNRQANWYYFELADLPAREVVLDLVNLVGEYNYRYGSHAVTRNSRPVYSYDRRAWTHFRDSEVEWDDKEVRLRLRFTPRGKRMWIAHVEPYTNQDLARLAGDLARSRYFKREVIGRTARGREMPLFTVSADPNAYAGKKVAWLMCRQHAWEAPTSFVCEGALRFLVSESPAARRVRGDVLFRVIPMADPDGVALGAVRFNVNGYDLNRNWDLVDPAKMPEIAAQRKAVLDWVDAGRPFDFFIALHNDEANEYVDGAFKESYRPVAERFFRALADQTTFHPTSPLREAGVSTTPGKPGRMTVNQGLFHDRGVPAMLMEQLVEYNPKLGRVPESADRLRFGEELARAIWAGVTGHSMEELK